MLLVIFIAALCFFALERAAPDQDLAKVPGWWPRAVALNLAQLGIVVLAGATWDHWLRRFSLVELGSILPLWAGATIGYLFTTFVYYWWHRARHDLHLLWLTTHQVHHSPARLEVITSFYKHPVEILCNGVLSSLISYTLLGLTIEGAAWVTVVSAIAEFFYHMNVATPRWVGYFVQRPEMHRIHHQRGRHYDNFADLPVWDMLFGTFKNPSKYDGACGFSDERERALAQMLAFRDVNREDS